MVLQAALPLRDSAGKISKECMSFARLYTDDIEDYFKLYSYRTLQFRPFFDEQVYDDLARAEKLALEVTRKATTNEDAFDILDELLLKDKPDLYHKIHLALPASCASSFREFSARFLESSGCDFLVLDRVAAAIDIDKLIDIMCADGKYPALRAATAGPKGGAKVARRFLRELPRLEEDGEDWFWSLVKACSEDGYNASVTLEYLLPNWRAELAARRIPGSATIACETLDGVLLAGASCRPPKEFEVYRDESTVPGSAKMPELRMYQQELVERTDRGENTIVCAPTGSGKTVVAAHVALHHLKSRAKEGKPARVVMIVPKVFLVEQQTNLMKIYSKREYYIATLSGETTETGAAQLIRFLSGDIVMLTPQIMVNMLKEESERARLFVADVSLLLLDECHHTDKKNPYNVIMQYVKDAPYEKPQVVGLTASLGVGDNGIILEAQAFSHIVRMCLRMTAQSITTVMRNRAELSRFVELPEDVIKRVHAKALHERPFHSHLVAAIRFAERHLYAEFDALMREQPPNIDFNKFARFPALERVEDYTQAVVNADTELCMLTDGERKWRLKRGIQFVKMYYNAMMLNDLLPASYAYEQLYSDVDALDSVLGRQCLFLQYFQQHRAQFAMSVAREDDKEILSELRKELARQFALNAGSRVLIFCVRRETAQLLAKYLNTLSIAAMGRAEVLTSTNAAAVKNGQSNSEQRAVIESFSRGTCKVIVSTTVAEEGLDVQACNLIIKYNNTGNVISLVQQRGRARAAGSRSVLLALDERVYLKEHQNKSAEEVMTRTVAKIYDMGAEKFGEALRAEELIQIKVDLANEKAEESRRANKHRELSLLCEKCNASICSSSTLRLFHNHFISVDSSLWRKMRIQAKRGPKIDESLMVAGVVRCPCEKEIGRVVKIEGQFVPTLKAETILFSTPGGKLLPKMKKWKGIAANLLEIREGTGQEAIAMNRALRASHETLSRAMENLCLL
ncbi:hypothetical protein PFISCL1PPCAC_559 [Pristionchus fissidentatus]|uniref:RNA helicase n=1 Tax=Pristionchus fissidentatus TaxID=1538716 RepID=A0AAV5UQ65_9BILA|nr:hypothetical protein PFISCL1PPCAC_559 [Pristionchus fissidentatus]